MLYLLNNKVFWRIFVPLVYISTALLIGINALWFPVMFISPIRDWIIETFHADQISFAFFLIVLGNLSFFCLIGECIWHLSIQKAPRLIVAVAACTALTTYIIFLSDIPRTWTIKYPVDTYGCAIFSDPGWQKQNPIFDFEKGIPHVRYGDCPG